MTNKWYEVKYIKLYRKIIHINPLYKTIRRNYKRSNQLYTNKKITFVYL